ncbi:MAG TPA: ComEC/Rec2 family competence protein, partial [Terriglobia bacterium]|nr:ComEC/Rec2 family competence protein [Terriglobia bacterium]
MRGQTDEERPRGFLSAPVLLVGASFALGIAAADAPAANPAWTLANTPVLIALAGILMLAGLLLVRGNRRSLAGLVALAGFALAGLVSARLFECRFPPAHVSHLENTEVDLRDAIRISGRIISSPLPTESGIQFDMEVSELDDRGRNLPIDGTVRMRLQRGPDAESAALAGGLELQYGDSIRTLATLRRPTSYRNPGVFDFRRRMTAIEDVHWIGTIKSPLMVERLPGRNEFKLDV